MEPTLPDGSVVWVNHWAFLFQQPKEGDVVVFKTEGKEMLKRVERIESGGLYLLGDNKTDSLDSRKLGLIEGKKIVGKALLKNF